MYVTSRMNKIVVRMKWYICLLGDPNIRSHHKVQFRHLILLP